MIADFTRVSGQRARRKHLRDEMLGHDDLSNDDRDVEIYDFENECA